MPARFRRSTRVRAPLDAVWAFHSTADGLVALTPDWMGLRVERTRGPDGDPDPDVLDAGSEVRVSVRPFGVGPRQSWTSRITARERTGDEAVFRDVMLDGPFAAWTHTHRFRAVGDATIVTDDVEYALPWPLGPISRGAVVGLAPMFAYRHRRTRKLLEG